MKSENRLLPRNCYPMKVKSLKLARPMDVHFHLIFTAEEVGHIIQAVSASALSSDDNHKDWLKVSKDLLAMGGG